MCASLLLFFSLFASSASAQASAKDAFGDPLPEGAIARIGTTRFRLGLRHEFPMLSPDGTFMVKRKLESELEIWEVPGWEKRRTLACNIDQNDSRAHAFTADSKRIAIYQRDKGTVALMELASGRIIKQLPLPEMKSIHFQKLQISADQRTLVCAVTNDATQSLELVVWDLSMDKVRHSLQLRGGAANMWDQFALSPDGKLLAHTYDRNNQAFSPSEPLLEFWDLDAGKSIRKLPIETRIVRCAFSPDGQFLAARLGQALRIYESATGKECHNLRLRRAGSVLAIAPDSKSVYVEEDKKITQWDFRSGERVATYTVPAASGHIYIEQLAFTPQRKILAVGTYYDALILLDVVSGRVYSPQGIPAGAVLDVCFSLHGELFIGAADQMGWWNPRTGRKKRDQLWPTNDEGINPIGWPPLLALESELCASFASGWRSIRDLKTGELLYDDTTPDSNPAFAFFDHGTKAAALYQNTLRLWHSRTGRDFAKFDLPLQPNEQPQLLAASTDGKQFAFATHSGQEGGRVVLWDYEQKKIVREWPWSVESPARTLAFAPDNRWLAIAGQQGRLQLSRVGRGKGDHNLAVAKEGFDLTHIAFAPDSRQLACALAVPVQGVDRGKIVIFEVASKKIRLELPGHVGGIIHRLAYSHDGALLASGSADTTALVWRAGLRAFAEMRHEPEASATVFAKVAGADAKAAFQAMIQLVQTPKEAVALLEQKMAPAQKPDTGGRTLAQWIDDLGSGNFAVRTKASAMLQRLGPDAESALRTATARPRDLEIKRRLEELLERIANRNLTPEEVLHVRAVEVLEAIATPEARALLQRWSKGHASAVLTEEAQKALARLR